MLAQQSPRFICRVCLSAQARSVRYRRLTQVREQSTDSSQNNDAATNETSQRRIPLKELLERRKLESQAVTEPADETKKEQHSKDSPKPRKFSMDFFRRKKTPKE